MRLLIAGATSAIAGEVAKCFAAEQAELFLVARDPEKLAAVAADLRVRGAQRVETALLDLTDVRRHAEVIEAADAALGGLDAALLAHGVLPDQAECERSASAALAALEVNLTSTIALLTLLANYFERRRAGLIAVISSVSGDRGRQSNYVYGASKAGLTVFLQGLRNRLHRSGVAVLTIKPGPVDTPMTARMRKTPLFADRRRVGRSIHRAMVRRRDVVYVPWFWRPIKWVIRAIPEWIFKRLRL